MPGTPPSLLRRLPSQGDRLVYPTGSPGGHLPVREEGVLPAALSAPG